MKLIKLLKTVAVVLAAVNLAVPLQYLRASEPAASVDRPTQLSEQARKMGDVALGPDGRLQGLVIDAAGHPRADYRVSIEQFGQRVGETVTDKAGKFALDHVRGGVCRIITEDMVSLCRCWVENTAPPAAASEVLVVADSAVARGQRPIGEILCNPVLIGLLIAAAIAIPIAVHNRSGS